MKDSSFLVSVIIPVFNREVLVLDSLTCVKKQTHANWECLIVDDRSDDNSVNVIKAFIKEDERFKLFIRPESRTKGASTCRNIGLENASGDYIQFLDSDDIISFNKLEIQLKVLVSEEPNCIATCSWGRFSKEPTSKFVHQNLKSYRNFENVEDFLMSLVHSKGYFPIHAYLINRSLINKTGPWNESLTLNDDGEFVMRLLLHTDKVLFANEGYALYREKSGENVSSFSDKVAVNKAILSWKMIAVLFKTKLPKNSLNYIEYVKEGVYINTINSFPELVKEHKSFFRKQIMKRSFIYKVLRKIKA